MQMQNIFKSVFTHTEKMLPAPAVGFNTTLSTISHVVRSGTFATGRNLGESDTGLAWFQYYGEFFIYFFGSVT